MLRKLGPNSSPSTTVHEAKERLKLEVRAATKHLSPDARELFYQLTQYLHEPPRTRALCRRLGFHLSSLNSRHDRWGLPTPKVLGLQMQLTLAARLLQQPWPCAEVAYQVGASSPQAFGRLVRQQLGITVLEFRARSETYDWYAAADLTNPAWLAYRFPTTKDL